MIWLWRVLGNSMIFPIFALFSSYRFYYWLFIIIFERISFTCLIINDHLQNEWSCLNLLWDSVATSNCWCSYLQYSFLGKWFWCIWVIKMVFKKWTGHWHRESCGKAYPGPLNNHLWLIKCLTFQASDKLLQVKPTRAGSSIGVTVAYGVTDSLKKAREIISEVLYDYIFSIISGCPVMFFYCGLIKNWISPTSVFKERIDRKL